jgi:N-acetylmuramoyl-L-alanine amidase
MSKFNKHGLLAIFAALLLVFSVAGKGQAASFSDMPANGASEISYLVDRGIITGYTDGTFRPYQHLTREEAAIIIGKALSLDGTQRATSFPDVGAESIASGYIQSAYEKGIINGMNDGTYSPNSSMTRGQMAFLLQRAFNLTEKSNITFIDVASSGAQFDAIDRIATAGITNGYSDGKFRPAENINRAEFAMFVARALNESFRVKIAAPAHTIAIDPGHGGSDPGAIGVGGLQEKELNLSVALKVENLLRQRGINVYLTRRDDTFIELNDRVTRAVNSGADTFVSIHANSFSGESANGTETYYSIAGTRADDSKQLATFIQNRLYPALGTKNRGVKTAKYVVINTNPLPAALVELGFVSNNSDASKLASDDYRNRAADAIALGIQDYYDWKY